MSKDISKKFNHLRLDGQHLHCDLCNASNKIAPADLDIVTLELRLWLVKHAKRPKSSLGDVRCRQM